MIASWISRVRFDVMIDDRRRSSRGSDRAPGIVIWNSASTSSRYASNGSSVRSSSSISSTGGMPSSGDSASSSGRFSRKRGAKMSCASASAIDAAGRFREPDLDHLPRVIPFVRGRRDVESFVALEADELLAEHLRQHLGELGLADAGLAFQEHRAAHLERKKHARRETAIGDVVVAVEQREDVVDGSG